jgi:hypothetical protein
MANYSKAFNFRGGFQVDTDVLVVRGEKVGIGSTSPVEVLDVNGIVKAKGLKIDSTQDVDLTKASIGILTVRESMTVGVSSLENHGCIIAIGSGIITSTLDSVGLVTYYGDGRFLQGLPTSQWLDVDIGLGYTSIYAQGNVGVDTIDPRYKFQVGGVPFVIPAGLGTLPFRFNQEGVGIQSGCVYISDDLRVGGGVSISGTIGVGQTINVDGNIGVSSNLTVVGFVSAYEFIGIGSQISLINADNIAIGSIGSMRYGDTIVTKEVYANRFIGTATMAEDLVPEAQINIDIARADEVDAITRFISTEGKLQIGSDTPVNDVSDIDLFRSSGNATVSGVATIASARVFVGRERPSVGNREYGGIRYGGDIGDAPSTPSDLDVVNYSTGNLNSYLHSGSGGATTGSFRWIYGQTDRILAELNKDGKFSLFGNSVSGNVNLSVVGLSTFEDIRAETANVVGLTTIGGDLTVYGTLNIAGNIGVATDLTFGGGATFNGDVIITDDPLNGGTGIKLGADGVITASNGINLVFGGNQVFGVTPSGGIVANGTINAQGNIDSAADITGDTVTGTTSLIGPSMVNVGSIVSVNGDLQVTGTSTLNNLESNVSSLGIADATSMDFAGGTFIDSSSITVNTLSAANLTGSLVVSGDLSGVNDITASGIVSAATIQANSGEFNNVTTNNLDVDSITSNLQLPNGFDAGSTSTVVTLTADNISVTDTFDTDILSVDQVNAKSGAAISFSGDIISTSAISASGDIQSGGNLIGQALDITTGEIETSFGRVTLSLTNSTTLTITVTEPGQGPKSIDLTLS